MGYEENYFGNIYETEEETSSQNYFDYRSFSIPRMYHFNTRYHPNDSCEMEDENFDIFITK